MIPQEMEVEGVLKSRSGWKIWKAKESEGERDVTSWGGW